MEENNCTNPGG